MARGRRLARVKLRPLAPHAEAKYFRNWSSNELRLAPQRFPSLTSAALFGNSKPLEVEIGSGTGEFLVQLAAQNPHTNFLGIDVSRRRSLYAAALAADAALENVLFIRANFRLLSGLAPEAGWQRIYLHFPDPIHKHKDQKRSVYGPGFLDAVAHALAPGGQFSLVSDKPAVFFPLLEQIEADPRFEKRHAERYLEGTAELPKSRFQHIWERRGVVPFRLLVRRT